MPKILQILLLSTLLSVGTAIAGEPPVELKPGMVISSSVVIKAGTYHLNGTDSLNRAVILIQGDNITVDFNKAVLQGSNDKQLPNEFYGLAVLIKGNNITIRNAIVNGYKVALMATGCKNLTIENCNLSYNYRQHLQSSWLHEDLSDWMSYHHNENDEWLRYGAGIYLKDCDDAIINNTIVTGGQCGLMMMRCKNGWIFDNNFGFNSGIGIGMYRSDRNHILHNRLNFNVRGYSHGFFKRGQDSGGILVFEQCNYNIFAYNSATHSGDGFFLWAGQTTMDGGEGGCNQNYLYMNDFSYAPTNGVEVTFSSNSINTNRIVGCDNGIWGGYSFNTAITNNIFKHNNTAIAIEHGHDIYITTNNFDSNKVGIKLWAKKEEPSDWGFPKKNNTNSRRYTIRTNHFKSELKALDIKNTDSISIFTNYLRKDYDSTFLFDKTNSNIVYYDNGIPTGPLEDDENKIISYIGSPDQIQKIPKKIPDEFMPGRENIRITEWGPYDYRYPIIFLKSIDSNNIYHFDLLGPKGKFKIKNARYLTNISQSEGTFPATITGQKTGPDVRIVMGFTGDAFTDQFGKPQPATRPYVFSFRDFQPLIEWNVNWYTWDAAHDPNKNYELFKTVFNNAPVKSEQAKKIDYTWWGAIGKNLPADSFATVAVGTVDVPKGLYNLGVTADDLVKVFIDGKLVIDFWDASKYKNDEDAYHSTKVELGGKHTIRIEHVENSGYATLIFYLKPL